MNRAQRRAAGFRGAVAINAVPENPRYIRRHGMDALFGAPGRRRRKRLARMGRILTARGQESA